MCKNLTTAHGKQGDTCNCGDEEAFAFRLHATGIVTLGVNLEKFLRKRLSQPPLVERQATAAITASLRGE